MTKAKPRVPQNDIAKFFGCCGDTVRSVQRAAGLRLFPEMTSELENKIVEALRQGKGQNSVSKAFHVSTRKVHLLMVKHAIVRGPGNPGLPPDVRAKIVEAVAKRENFCVRIAKKVGVHPTTVQKIAHELLGEGPLLNHAWPPLQSPFPQREVREQIAKHVEKYVGSIFPLTDPPKPIQVINSEDALFLVDLVVRTCFGGIMPDNFVGFAEVLAEKWLEQIPREVWNSLNTSDQNFMRHSLAIEFLHATNTVRTMAVQSGGPVN